MLYDAEVDINSLGGARSRQRMPVPPSVTHQECMCSLPIDGWPANEPLTAAAPLGEQERRALQ